MQITLTQLHNSGANAFDPSAGLVFKNATSDLKNTLDECEEVIASYRPQRGVQVGVIRNLNWNLNGKPRCAQLQKKLDTQISILNLINGVLRAPHHAIGTSLDQPLSLDAEESDLLQRFEPRFREALSVGTDKIPSSHLFSAICWRWHRSTKQVEDGGMVNSDQFLNLYKATWLLEIIEKRNDESWLSVEVLHQLKTGIAQEHEREDVRSFNATGISQLPLEDFAILPPSDTTSPELVEEDEEIFSGQLIPETLGDVELKVFRIRKHAHAFRFWTTSGGNAPINAQTHSVIPTYIVNLLAGSRESIRYTINTRASNISISCYELRDRDTVQRLQNVLTGYQTKHQVILRGWDFKRSRGGQAGSSMCQIWVPKYKQLERNTSPDQRRWSGRSQGIIASNMSRTSTIRTQNTTYTHVANSNDWSHLAKPLNPRLIIFHRDRPANLHRAIRLESKHIPRTSRWRILTNATCVQWFPE